MPSRPYVQDAFGDVLRSLREQKELSQEALAHGAGLHRNYVGMMERGERGPTVYALFRLAEVLGVRPREIIAKVEARDPTLRKKPSHR